MRKVSVGLEADVAGFVKGVLEADKSVEGLDRKVDGLDRSIKKIPADAAKAGAAMKLLGADAQGIGSQFDEAGGKSSTALKLLDKKIEETRATARRFAEEFNRNGSTLSFDLWQSASKDLGGLERVKNRLTKALSDGGKAAESSLMKSLVIAAIAAAPLIGSMLGAAIIGGGGVSLIGAGIIGQVKNPAVRAAFADLGAVAKGELTNATAPFGPALVKGAAMLGAELDRISPKLHTIFELLAPVFEKLLGGGIGFFDRLLPGLDAVSRAAGPVLGALAEELPQMGDALTSMFKSISAGAPGAASGLHTLFTVIDGLLVAMGKLIEGFEMLPGPVQVGVAVIGLLGGAFLYLGPKIMAAKAALAEFSAGTLAADTRMGSLARTAGWAALALTAVQVAGAALGHSASTGVERTTKALDDLTTAGKATSEVTKHLDYDLGTLSSSGLAKTGNAIAAVVEAGTGLGGVFDESLQHARERIASLDAALADEVRNGHAGQAAQQFNTLAEAAKKQGISIDDLMKALPQYADALAAAAAANQKAGASAKAAVDDFDLLAAAINKTAITANSLEAAMVKKIFTATMDLDRAILGVNESLLQVGETFEKNGRAIDKHTGLVANNTEKGIANRRVVLSAVEDNMRLYQSNIALGVSTEVATETYEANTAALEKQLRQAGLTKGQIDDLIGKYRNIPRQVDTDIAMHGLTDAIQHLDDTISKVNHLDGRQVDIYFQYHTKGQSLNAPLAHGGIRKAATGLIVGPSDPGTLIAEPQTGGEALIPLRGIAPTRAAMLGQIAMAGYGYNVVPQGAGGGGMATLRVIVQNPDGRVLRDEIVNWNANRGRTDPATFFLP